MSEGILGSHLPSTDNKTSRKESIFQIFGNIGLKLKDGLLGNHVDSGPGKNLSRRDFLKLSTIAGGSLMLNACMPTNFTAESKQTSEPSQTTADHLVQVESNADKEALEKVGLGDFYPFYQKTIEVALKYGTFADGYYFNRIFTTCWDVVSGVITKADNPDVIAIRDGWGEKSEQVNEDAIKHIYSLQIANHDVPGDPEIFREKYLKKFAAVFGSMAVAIPPQIYLAGSEAKAAADMMVVYAPSAGWGSVMIWEVFFHEATHAVDIWSDRVQPYLSKNKFVDYITAYYREADSLIEQWLKIPTLEEADAFFSGFIRSWGDFNSSGGELLLKLEAIEDRYFNKVYTDESPATRFMRVAWTLGGKIQLTRQKERAETNLNEAELQLLNDEDMTWIMSWLVEYTLHFLVNPPENYFSNEESDNRLAPTVAREKMMEVRLDTFVTMPVDANFPRDDQLRKALEIL